MIRAFTLACLAALGLLGAAAFPPPAFAQAPAGQPADEPRVALVIGNARYKDSPLLNPVNDARALSSALRAAGFEVIELHEQGSAACRARGATTCCR